MSDFLPAGYKPPTTSDYMKLQDGPNKIRILSKPILGWEDWENKKPLRFRFDNMPLKPIDPTKPFKHFWAMVVWNHQERKIQILEITQVSIQKPIQALIDNDDWGSPFGYDITIDRSGSGMDTEYAVMPSPHKPVSDEIKAAYKAKPCDLNALFTGGDPFAGSKPVDEPVKQKKEAPEPSNEDPFEEVPHPSEVDDSDLPF